MTRGELPLHSARERLPRWADLTLLDELRPVNDLEVALVRAVRLDQVWPLLMAMAGTSLVLPQPPWWTGEGVILPELEDAGGKHAFAFTSYEQMVSVYPDPELPWALVPTSAIVAEIAEGTDLWLNPGAGCPQVLGAAHFEDIGHYLSWNRLQPGPSIPDEIDAALLAAVRDHPQGVREVVRAFVTEPDGELVRHLGLVVARDNEPLLAAIRTALARLDHGQQEVRLWLLPTSVEEMTDAQALLYGRSATLWALP